MNTLGRLGLLTVLVGSFAQTMDIVLAGKIPPTDWLRLIMIIVGGAMFVMNVREGK